MVDSFAVDRKIILTAGPAIDVPDAEKSLKSADTLAMKHGDFVTESSFRRSRMQVTAALAVRVPAAKVTRFTDELAALATVTGRSSGSEDVTPSYIDIQARLKVLRAEEEQFVTFLEKATMIKGMLAVREQLPIVRTGIDRAL